MKARPLSARSASFLPLLAAVAVTAACSTGPSEAQIVTQSDQVRGRVFAAGVDAAALVERDFADSGVEVEHYPEFDDRWTECSDQLAQGDEPPTLIQWSTSRTFIYTSPRETASLIDEIGQRYVADGWVRGREINMDAGGRSVPFRKDGYTVRWGGTTTVEPDRISALGLSVTGPCIPAPQDIREWEPTPGGAEPPPAPTTDPLD